MNFQIIRSTKAAAAVLLVSGLFGATSPAWAVLVDCAGSLSHVDSSTACQYVSPPDNNNVANEANVNAAGFFGITNWSVVDGWLQTNANAGSGSWDIGSLTAGLSYMITFKDGADTNLISFLITAASGNWTTPFTEPPFDFNGGSTVHNVSHFSIFSSGTPTTNVPEPAMLTLFGLGLLSLGFARRKKA